MKIELLYLYLYFTNLIIKINFDIYNLTKDKNLF